MAENITELAVGGVTIAVAAAFGIYAAQITGVAAVTDGAYPLSASFRSAQGIDVGTDVRLAGIRVGTVTGMQLNPETFRADMAFAIDGAVRVPEDSAVSISTEGLLGVSYVEIVPGESPFDLEPGSEFTETEGARSLIGLLAQVIASAASE